MLWEIISFASKYARTYNQTEKVVEPLVRKGFELYYKDKDVYDIFYKSYYKQHIRDVLQELPEHKRKNVSEKDFIEAYSKTKWPIAMMILSFNDSVEAKDTINAIKNAVLRNHDDEYSKLYNNKQTSELCDKVGDWYGEALYEVYLKRIADFN